MTRAISRKLLSALSKHFVHGLGRRCGLLSNYFDLLFNGCCWLVCVEHIFHLLIGHQYIVGRRDCDIIVPHDMSVSRKHAIIKFIYAESDIVSHYSQPLAQCYLNYSGAIWRFLPHRGNMLHRWGWNLPWRSQLLHAKFYPHRCNVSPLWGENLKITPWVT